MSSKRPDPAKSPKRWSITGRLAFLYTLSALVTLGVIAIFFIWAMRDSMYREESDFLNDRLRVYGSIIESQPNHLQIIRRDIDWEGAYVAFPEYYTRIVAGSTTILETPGMARLIPPALFSTPPTRRRRRRFSCLNQEKAQAGRQQHIHIQEDLQADTKYSIQYSGSLA